MTTERPLGRARPFACCLLAAVALTAAAACGSEAQAASSADPVEPATSEADPLAIKIDLGNGVLRAAADLGIHDQWRKLWEDHITWTRMVIIGIADSLPGTVEYEGRLLKNYDDMESALEPMFGKENAEAFGNLVKEHLVIAASLVRAAKLREGSKVDALLSQWRANANQLAEQMNAMNPKFWPLESTRAMWQTHLSVTLAEATRHLAGDFPGEIAAWEAVHTGGLQMADMTSRGIILRLREPVRAVTPTPTTPKP